jgi:hypothetical protein
MGNNVNRNAMQCWIGRIKHAPVTGPELEMTRESACQCLQLDLIEMLGEPLDFCGDTLCNMGIEPRKVF